MNNSDRGSVFSLIARQSTEPMKTEEENELHAKWAAGCKRSGDKLVRSHFRNVLKWTTHYSRAWDQRDDLAAAGMQGLMTAMKKFDTTRGVPFYAYSTNWIRAAISDHATKMRHMMSGGPRAQAGRFLQLRAEAAKVEHLDSPEAKEVALAEALKTSPKEARRALDYLRSSVVWMDADGGDDHASLHERIAAETEETGEDLMLRNRVGEALANLKAMERDVLIRRLVHDESLESIGKSHGVTREWIRQIEAKALIKARKALAPLAMDRPAYDEGWRAELSE